MSALRKDRLSPDELDRARRVDLVALVSREIKLVRDGAWMAGLCPFHKEKTPSFKLKDGRYKCFGCGASGDVIEYVQLSRKLEFADAVKYLAGSDALPKLQIVSRQKRPEPSSSPEVAKAGGIWRQGVPVPGTVVETYLRARGLSTFPASIRCINNYNWFPNLSLPCMVVAVQGPTGIIIGVQLTALTVDGSRKAFAQNSRRTEGILAAGAVRFGAAGDAIGLAEGTEKGIAAQELSGVPTWASLGAHRLQTVVIPGTVRELHLFGDNDEPGREAVEKTAHRHKHRRVVVRFPPIDFKDWDEFLLARRRT